jgi:hypothetical protein
MIPSISLMLVYEPATSRQGPVPLARIEDGELAVLVARAAIAAAESRAAELARTDCYLGEVEQAEAERLKRVLMLLVPGLEGLDQPISVVTQ